MKILAADRGIGSHFTRSTLAASVKDYDVTLECLSRALSAGELSTVWMRSDARFDALRSTSEFGILIDQLEAQRLS